jgi:predicted ATPase
VPFWSLGEVIREECGILFGDPLEAARRKVDESVQRLGATESAAPALKAVLALGSEGLELTRDALFAGMRAFFEALARHEPLLLILEDVHSAEDVTLDFLGHAADWIREAPIMLIILSRPELLERRPSWLGGKRSATTLFLDPLGVDESQALALGILQGRRAPDAFMQTIVERAGGNPLFMEEMLRTLIEQRVLVADDVEWSLTVPADQVAIPDTVHAVIAARIDALPAAEKHLLQAAAVEGKDFWRGALGTPTEEGDVDSILETLVSKDLVTRKPPPRSPANRSSPSGTSSSATWPTR